MSSVSRRQTLSLGFTAGIAAAGSPAPAEAAGPPATFTLLLVNDIYRMGEENGRGGYARLAAIVRAERARGVPMLFCHAGDCFSPSLLSGLDRGAHVVELLNLIRPDVFVPGNHEFDFGPDVFAERLRESRFPYFAANLRGPDGAALPGIRDAALVPLGPVRVGIVGIALEATPSKAQSGDLRFGPELETLAARAAELRAAGAEFLVAVTHTDRATDERIVRSGLVDVLLTGHDHDLAISYDGRTAMVESSEEGYFVTAVDIAVTRSPDGKISWTPSFRPHSSAAFEPDPAVGAVIARLEAELASELGVVIGTTAVELDSRTDVVRTRESAMGNLVADSIRLSTGAEIALVNGGGLRGNAVFPAGSNLTRRNVLAELPFGNTTVLVEITGATVKALLENGFADLGRPAGRFPQVSGLATIVDRAAPAGSRVVTVTVEGTPLDPERRYRVGSVDFLYSGGNGYGALASGRTLIGPTDGRFVSNEVMSHVRRIGTVTTGVEGRIVIR